MRKLLTTADAIAEGMTHESLKWGVKKGKFHRAAQGVYLQGEAPASLAEQALALAVATGGVVSGSLAAYLYELDGVKLKPPYVTVLPGYGCDRREVRRCALSESSIVEVQGFKCTDGVRTLVDLSCFLNDLEWEQALESALRKKLLTLDQLVDALQQKRKGNSRIRRVLALRPDDAPPTESMLETLMVQLIRTDPCLPTPQRQEEIYSNSGNFVARVDLSWPKYGAFIELDGQQHKDQPVYDANRETSVVMTTGWLPGRFTWYEVNNIPKVTLRRVAQLLQTAKSKS